MKWTKEPPSESGYYWSRQDGRPPEVGEYSAEYKGFHLPGADTAEVIGFVEFWDTKIQPPPEN